LTTFKTLEESIIEDQDTAHAIESTFDDDIKKMSPPKVVDLAMLEKQSDPPTTITKPIVL